MLNLAWVRTFLALVEHKSFRSAAGQLQLAQPTVSQQLRKLEQQLGVVLLTRSRLGCAPTPAAVAFIPYAESLVRIHQRAIAAVQRGEQRIGASSNVGIYVLQPYLKTYLDGRDLASFDIAIDRNPAIAQKLSDSEIDVAVMEWWDKRPGFQWKEWRREPREDVRTARLQRAARREIHKEELATLVLLGGETGTGTGHLLDTYFRPGEPGPQISALQLGSTEAVKQAVKAGLGISLVLRSAVAEEVASGSLRAIPVKPELSKDIFVIWRGIGTAAVPPFVTHLTRSNPPTSPAACD
ncbi:LysR family transcriptional regulator [Bradyrhizobium sp.]|uniref:LysR family transcriptional regulator n=1 Tax=Bradyrhizobium sp. TaxID=376 RepID=UPI00391913B7